MTNTTLKRQYHNWEPTLYVAIELSAKKWKLAFTTGLGRKPRHAVVDACDLKGFLRAVEAAKGRFGLPSGATVVSCHEAGRDGFWLHRWLLEVGIHNVVVDSASIEVNRRRRRVKSDKLDAAALARLLVRWALGECGVWKVVNAPSREWEDARQLQRELKSCREDRTAVVNRIRSLLACHGTRVGAVNGRLGGRVGKLLDGTGRPLPPDLVARLEREVEHWKWLHSRILELKRERRRRLRDLSREGTAGARRLWSLKAIGLETAWTLEHELFGWRRFRNGRQVGSLTGLAPSQWGSGGTVREQGISKAGVRRVRALAVEVAWMWVRLQPQSDLARWFDRRFAGGGKRVRKIGIVALARKLIVQLWRFRETGVPPAGARFKSLPL